MSVTINELVTKFTFNVDKAGANQYEDAIKKASNTEKQAFKEKVNSIKIERQEKQAMYTSLFKQLDDNLAHEKKIKNDIKKSDLKSIQDIRKAKDQMYTEMFKKLEIQDKKDRQRSEQAFKEWTKIQENKKANLEFQEKLKEKNHLQELQGLETTKQRVTSFHSTRLQQIQKETSAIRNQGDIQNRGFADINSRLQRNTSTRLQQIQKETQAIVNRNRTELNGLDEIRKRKRELLDDLALTGLGGLGAKGTFDKLIATPVKVASDMEKANIFLQTFGDTDAQGQKFINKKIKEGAKLGAAMPLDIEQMVIELGKAGYKGKGSGEKNELANMIPFIMKLSRATGGTPTEAGELLTNTAASFSISSKEGYSRLTDMFTYALNESKLNFQDLNMLFRYAGNPAAVSRQSIPDMLANAAIMRQKGVTGSQMGTGYRQMSTRPAELAQEIGTNLKKNARSKPIKEAYETLGIKESDILNKGGGLDINKLYAVLRKTFKMDNKNLEAIALGTYKGEQLPSVLGAMKTMKALFGQTALPSAMSILTETKQDKNLRQGFKEEKFIGESDRVTGKLNKGLDYQSLQAEIEWYYAKQNFGKQFLPLATKLAKALTSINEAFSNMTPNEVGFVNYIGILTASFTGLLAGAKAFNMIAPLLGKSWAIGLGPVGWASLAVADLVSYLTGGPSMTGGLIWSLEKLQKYLASGNFAKFLGQFASDFVNAADKIQFLIDKIKALLGLTPTTQLGGSPTGGTTSPSLAPSFGSSKAKYQYSTYMDKPMAAKSTGATHKSSRNETVINIEQVINANNSGSPEKIGKTVKHVTKEALSMINGLKAQRA